MISMPYKDMPEGSPMAAGVWHSISKCLDAEYQCHTGSCSFKPFAHAILTTAIEALQWLKRGSFATMSFPRSLSYGRLQIW